MFTLVLQLAPNMTRARRRLAALQSDQHHDDSVAGLESGDQRTQYYAVFLLAKVGPAAAEALPSLRKLLDESESRRFKERLQSAIDDIEVKSE